MEVHTSIYGKTFTKVDEGKSKATNGNSSEKLNYSFTLDTSQTALAGFSLLSLLLLPAFRSRMANLALLIIVVINIAACTKEDAKPDTTVTAITYIKLIQPDLDGKTTDLGIIAEAANI